MMMKILQKPARDLVVGVIHVSFVVSLPLLEGP